MAVPLALLKAVEEYARQYIARAECHPAKGWVFKELTVHARIEMRTGREMWWTTVQFDRPGGPSRNLYATEESASAVAAVEALMARLSGPAEAFPPWPLVGTCKKCGVHTALTKGVCTDTGACDARRKKQKERDERETRRIQRAIASGKYPW